MTSNLGQFAAGVVSWRRLIAAMPDDEGRWTVFENAAHEVATYVVKGLDRVEAADQLHQMATANGLDNTDAVQEIIADAFGDIEQRVRDKPKTNGSGNGHDTSHHEQQLKPTPPRKATPYIPPNAADIPKRQWLYGMHYMRGIVTATVAPGGFGKTTLSLHEAISMAVAGSRVWYISAEDDRDEIDRRIAAHMQQYETKPFDLLQRLFVDDKTSFPFKIAKAGNNNGVQFDEGALSAFEDSIGFERIDVVILDPFISFHYLNENDTAAMDALVKRLGDIALRYACCIELSHHVRKPSMGQIEITVYDARGAGAIVNAVRSCRVLNQMTRTAAEVAKIVPAERFRYIRIDSGKRNMAPPENARWCRLVNIELPNGDRVQALEAWAYPIDVTTDDDKTWLRVVLTKPLRAQSQSPNWIGIKVAARFGLDLENKDHIIAINGKLKRWAAEKLIARDDKLLDENRKPKAHWVLGEKAKLEAPSTPTAAADLELELPLDA